RAARGSVLEVRRIWAAWRHSSRGRAAYTTSGCARGRSRSRRSDRVEYPWCCSKAVNVGDDIAHGLLAQGRWKELRHRRLGVLEPLDGSVDGQPAVQALQALAGPALPGGSVARGAVLLIETSAARDIVASRQPVGRRAYG